MVDDVLAWLLDASDPGVRAKALVDLAGAAPASREVREARAASLAQGSIARVVEGLPADPAQIYVPKYNAAFHRVVALAEMGAPGEDARVARALDGCLDALARPDGGFGRTAGHLCVTGNLVRAANLLGRGDDPRVRQGVEWLVGQQQKDGGWNCWPDKRPWGTPDAWQALGAFAALPPRERPGDAVRRGLDHLLGARLGLDDPYEPWKRLHFPRHYYYDVLVGIDLATALGAGHDPRLAPALRWLESRADAEGRYHHEAHHPDLEGDDYAPYPAGMPLPLEPLVIEPAGAPSKWITLAARRALARAGRSPPRA